MNFSSARFDPTGRTARAVGSTPYIYHDNRIVLAVNIALATRRPLLVTGPPGSGKSTLAFDVAQCLEWAYVATTLTSRTRGDDLIARFDAVRRLSDAQANRLRDDDSAYLVPGALWWAFDPASAATVAGAASDPRVQHANANRGTVVLIDEIDKAEPDLPNDLLGPLDGHVITVPGRDPVAAKNPVLIVITSNGERAMPPAFLRRCLVLDLANDDPAFFTAVATSHCGEREDSLYEDVAARTVELVTRADEDRRRRPSMAEYLDTVKACIAFEQWPPGRTRAASPLWSAIEEAALRKTRTERVNGDDDSPPA